jgi:hypothetical protein
MGRVNVSAYTARHVGCTGAILSQYGAGLGVIVVPVISRPLSNGPAFQAGPRGIQIAYMPPVPVGNALRSLIPEDRSIPFDGIAAVYTFVYAVGIKVDTSEIVVVGIRH